MCRRHNKTDKYCEELPPATKVRKLAGSRGLLLAVYLQVSIFCTYWSLYHKSLYRPASFESTRLKHSSPDYPARVVHLEEAALQQSNIFVGISYSDKTVSDAAINFLLEAACLHNMESYILLGRRDPRNSLNRKISLFSQHKYMPPSTREVTEQLKCTHLIHIILAPKTSELIRQTTARLIEDGVNVTSLQSSQRIPNNPLDRENRIANIKRAREHQRQVLRDVFNDKEYDLEQSIIAVLDLDMFAYPPLSQVLEASEKYIRQTRESEKGNTTFHAICANGLQGVGHKNREPTRGYYDSFATILLPDLWLHSKQARMNQTEILEWVFENGIDSQDSEQPYYPVPVRSCFGGFTLYRADVWLSSNCRYDSYNKKAISSEFIGHKEHHTCEHVVLHECLRREFINRADSAFSIAVQPDLMTLWHFI
jgi:hypothetical protein